MSAARMVAIFRVSATLFNVSVYGASTTQSGSDQEGPITRATPSGTLSTGAGPEVSESAPSSPNERFELTRPSETCSTEGA